MKETELLQWTSPRVFFFGNKMSWFSFSLDEAAFCRNVYQSGKFRYTACILHG